MKNTKKAKGFTLVELVVTIAIITVLSCILITSVSGFIEQANNVADAADVRNIVTLLESEAILDGDFADTMVVNPYQTNQWNYSSKNFGYVIFMKDSIRVSTEEVAKLLGEAGYLDYDSGREYVNSGVWNAGIEYQYYNEAKTYSKDYGTNKGYGGTKSEDIKESTNLRCRSSKTWKRFQILWKYDASGNVKFYVQATTKDKGSNTYANKDITASNKLAELCGVPAYTGKDVDLTGT